MASENNLLNLPKIAGVDLSAHQYRAVRPSTTTVIAGTAGARCMGILQNEPTLGQAADVCVVGSSRAISGAAYLVGALLASNAVGKLVTAVAGDAVIAYALEAATAADETHEVIVLPGGSNFGALDVVTTVVGAEAAVAANAIEVAVTITDVSGAALTAARAGIITSQAETEGQGGITAAGTPVGTVAPTSAPATGNSTAGFLTSAAGLVSFRVTNTAAEVNVVHIQGHNCRPVVLILTFA